MNLIHHLFKGKSPAKTPTSTKPDVRACEPDPVISENESKSFTYRPTSGEGVRPTSEIRGKSPRRSK